MVGRLLIWVALESIPASTKTWSVEVIDHGTTFKSSPTMVPSTGPCFG